MAILKLSPLPIKDAVHAIETLAGTFDPIWGHDVIETRKRLANITAELLIEDGEGGEPGWAFINEGPFNFVNNGWKLVDQTGEAAKLTRSDGSDIYIAAIESGLTQYVSWLDRA